MASDIVSLHFTGTDGNNLGGYPVYPYFAQINGVDATVACDDFVHQSKPGDAWDAYRTYLSSNDISKTRFQNMQLYQEAAFLLGTYAAGDQLTQGEMNWAIWEMMDPGLQYSWDAGIQQTIDSMILNAQQNYQNGPAYWQELIIYTPVSSLDQEMIALAATPEPGTMLLLSSGIVGLWSQRKRIF
jgi:hypothetical protein